MGPAPKPDDERVTRHAPQFTWTNLPADGNPAPAPPLPRAPKGRAWLKQTRTWWAALWATPQSTQWRRDDPEMQRLAAMHDRFWRGESTGAELSEMRQIEDRHGLNPKAMLQLRWRIVDAEIETTTSARGKGRERYGHLKPVV
jgi:hypothetical protein